MNPVTIAERLNEEAGVEWAEPHHASGDLGQEETYFVINAPGLSGGEVMSRFKSVMRRAGHHEVTADVIRTRPGNYRITPTGPGSLK